MSQNDMYECLCKRCFIKINKVNKKEIKKMVMSEEEYTCDKCGKLDLIVDYVED